MDFWFPKADITRNSPEFESKNRGAWLGVLGFIPDLQIHVRGPMYRPLVVLFALIAAPIAVTAQPHATGEAPYEAFPHHSLPAFRAGAYQVTASLELPNVQDLDVNTKKKLCLVEHGGAANHGFEVMSENNPLAHCPMVNVRANGDTLTFDIKCPGSNLAKASATHFLMGDSFRGRINMTMGGKNMTMTEVQEGHRLGECQPPS